MSSPTNRVRAGKRIGYNPELIIWHTAWRTPEHRLADAYVGYARGFGEHYGKHLRRGDLRLLSWVGRAAPGFCESSAAGLIRSDTALVGSPSRDTAPCPPGLVAGWREAKPGARRGG